MNAHELGFTSFLAEPSRGRIHTLLELGEKRRKDACALLDHAVHLDSRQAQHLKGSLSLPLAVEQSLRNRGAPDLCYVISANADWDGLEMPVRDSLQAIIGSGHGSFVSCIPGVLGFFEYEDANSAYLLSRQETG